MAEEVLVIEEQFLEGGPCDVGEVEFGLRAGGAHPVALGDVLASRAGGLDHLLGALRAVFGEGGGGVQAKQGDQEKTGFHGGNLVHLSGLASNHEAHAKERKLTGR